MPLNMEKKRLANKNKACMIEDRDHVVCVDPSLPVLNLIGRKYTIMIIGVIGNSGNRKNFNEVLNDIPYSSSTIISRRLRELQDFGLILRQAEAEGVTYSLTELGHDVRDALLPVMRLMERHAHE
ncbi:MAG: helix-turn-helix domain-containing protein [Thermoplasmatales archaeon]|nr:helix-turn-helix domain-containing protein [Thermoplasmatales archaeon]